MPLCNGPRRAAWIIFCWGSIRGILSLQPRASIHTFFIEAGCILPNGLRELTCMLNLTAVQPTWKSPLSDTPRLSAEVLPRELLTRADQREMYQLLETYFENTS